MAIGDITVTLCKSGGTNTITPGTDVILRIIASSCFGDESAPGISDGTDAGNLQSGAYSGAGVYGGILCGDAASANTLDSTSGSVYINADNFFSLRGTTQSGELGCLIATQEVQN